MDIKKIDKIKAPEDWVEEALNPEKIQGISHRRNSMKKLRTAAAAVVIFLLCGTFVTVAAMSIMCFINKKMDYEKRTLIQHPFSDSVYYLSFL